MSKSNLIVLSVLVVLLGISTGVISIAINPSNLSTFMVGVIGIFYTYWMGGPGGNSGTGNGEKSSP